jgi:hypothetical protein
MLLLLFACMHAAMLSWGLQYPNSYTHTLLLHGAQLLHR